MDGIFSGAYVFVYFAHDISKTDAARIAKLDIEMFHQKFWEPVYSWVKGHCHEAQFK